MLELNRKKFRNTILAPFTGVLLSLALVACGGGGNDTTGGETTGGETTGGGGDTATQESAYDLPFDGTVSLTGAGATFPASIYQNWFVSLNKEVPQLQVNYQSVGSGAGVEQFSAATVDFGASDVAMTDEEMERVERGTLLLPVTAGAIVYAYNLPGLEGLKLTRQTYVDITLGKITRWNDPAITESNPDLALPDAPITFVHRSDGSGTTGFFTKHLTAISEEWAEKVGEGKTVQWGPDGGTFIGGKGNEGVTATIQQTEGAIGYVEYGYAKNNKTLQMAAIANGSGEFIYPTDEAASKTLANVVLPENLRAFITDPEGTDSYPIVTYTWIMAYKEYSDPDKAAALEAAIQYMLTTGQEVAPALGYIPLPANVVTKVAEVADQISPDYTIKVN